MTGSGSLGASTGRSPRLVLALLAAVGVALTGCARPAVGAPVATDRVDLPRSYRFAPVDITVAIDTTVTWTNNDTFTHNVRFEGEAPLTMRPGEHVTRLFDVAGTYPYVCSLHPQDMSGTVLVQVAAS